MTFGHLHILVVEDNPGDYILLREMLGILGVDKSNISNKEDLSQTVDFLHENKVDLIFLDLSLPDSEGLETFNITEAACNNSPIIVLSGSRDTEIALKTVKMGAQDFLIKGDFDGKILGKSISYSIERKRNLDHIKHSKQNYESLFEKNPLPMFAYDMQSLKFIYVNEAAVENYGYCKEEFLSMTILDIRPKDEWQKLKELIATRDPDKQHSGEWTHVKRNGHKIYVEVYSSPVTIDGIKSRLVLAHDITERKRVQSNVFFQANILQNITDIVIGTNLKGAITYWNQGASDCYGYDKEEVIGRSVSFIINPDEQSPIPQIISRLSEKKSLTMTTKVFSKFSKEVWVESKISYMYDVDGKKSGLLFISRDITDKVKTKNRLLLQKQALDAVGMGILITDVQVKKDHPIIYVNPKFQELTGYAPDEVIGKSCKFLQGEKTNKETIFRIKNAFKKQVHFQGEMLTYKKNGEYFWSFIVIDPVYDEESKLINFVGFIQDISLQKKSENELLYKNKELNTFIYRASHDLRSPIASLMGLSEVAKMEFEDQKVLQYFNMISQTSHRLDDILKNLLKLTAIKEGNPVYEEIILDDIIEEIMKNLEPHIDSNSSKLVLDFEKPAKLVSDKVILRSILQNLIENAYKYKKSRSDDHEVRLSFSHFNNKFRIVLADNGMGIKKEGISKVFDMFYRGTEVSKGSGLGLYIVKSFVDKLNGNVEIFSEYQVGTTFVLDLPEMAVDYPPILIPR